MATDLRQYLLGGKKPSLLVVGDIILDKFIWGGVERISPEAPVQVVNVRKETIALGGAANVANNLATLDCNVSMVGVIGDDLNGRSLKSELKRLRIDSSGVIEDIFRPTTTKTRVMAASQHVVRIDHETTDLISPEVEDKLLQYLKKHIAEFDAVIASDYMKGVLTDRLLLNLSNLCEKQKIPVIVDPKRRDFSAYSGVSLIKPNLKEAEANAGRSLKTIDDLINVGKEIRGKYDIDAVLITLGKDGMVLLEKRGHTVIPATAREVFDVTGAGDTVSAFLGMAVAKGASFADAARIANSAAAVAVSRMGTVTVSRDEVLHQFEESAGGSKKILSADELATILPGLRKGKKIVFTNGCFDILHVGHITLLNRSKTLGDKLIVGVNSDSSIRRIKGPKRPIVTGQERAHILAALESVDYVVFFDEDTPINLIKRIRPDILVKGSDYTPDKVVGRDFVESNGGRVALVDLVPGFSTTNIVKTILKAYSPTADKKLKKAQAISGRFDAVMDRFEKKIDREEGKGRRKK